MLQKNFIIVREININIKHVKIWITYMKISNMDIKTYTKSNHLISSRNMAQMVI